MVMGKPILDFWINWNKITCDTISSRLDDALRGDEVYWVKKYLLKSRSGAIVTQKKPGAQ